MVSERPADAVWPEGGNGMRPGEAGMLRRVIAALLRLELFYKILVANAAIVVLGAVAGTALVARLVRTDPGGSTAQLVALLAGVGVLVSVVVNAVILRLALRPLAGLERTAQRVGAGDATARAPRSQLADRELARLIDTFNGMLDGLAAQRRRTRELAARELGAAEAERKRIARELHDETAQLLVALLLRLRLAREAAETAVRDRLLDEAREQASEILEGVRRFARGLRPPLLDEAGLVPALEAHVRGLEEVSGMRITVEATSPTGALPPEVELALYRIVQEALSNVVRHAGASHARVRIGRADGAVEVNVEDDGHGFRVERVLSAGDAGLGLFGMKERAASLGGDVHVESEPGRGTRVSVRIPVGEGESNG